MSSHENQPREPARPAQEIDAWWGSFSSWALLPSLSVCVILTGVVAWWASTYLERSWFQRVFLLLSGSIWAVQTLRWFYRMIGYNYRMTSRRLIRERGIFYREVAEVALARVQKVVVQQGAVETWLGVGRVAIHHQEANSPLIFWGVPHPHRLALHIQEMVQKAEK